MVFAQSFGNAYRARNGHEPLLTERRGGTEHLVPGQHACAWTDTEQTIIELSYVTGSGHTFVIVPLDAETLEPISEGNPPRAICIAAEMNSADPVFLPASWSLSDKARELVEAFKASG